MKKGKRAAKKASSDLDLAKGIAEKAKPHMRAIEVAPLADESLPTADVSVAEEEYNNNAAGPARKASGNPGKKLHMVTMEPKVSSDQGPRRRTVIVDTDRKKIIGEAG